MVQSIISTKDLCDPVENITVDRWKLYVENLGATRKNNDNLPDYNHSITDNGILS